MRLGWAAGKVLSRDGACLVLIGKDTRISGYMFESALEAGLSAAGADIRLLGPMPTPGVAYLARNTRATAGIVISASHNPFGDNGIKFFSGDGTKLSEQKEIEIENQLANTMRTVSSHQLGKVRRINDAPRRYIEFCKSRVPGRTDLRELNVVLDCANGATYHIAPKVLEELGASVHCVGNVPNGLNINESCGACSPAELCRLVRETRVDVGIALDGDGDRLVMTDSSGYLVDGDELLFIIAKCCKDELGGGVVGTIMSNLGLERALSDMGIEFLRAQVGDRFVFDKLRTHDLVLGGESSGHIVHLGKATTGDGIIAALLVLQYMVSTGKSLHELRQGMCKVPQRVHNVQLFSEVDINEIPAVRDAFEEAKSALGAQGRVVLRNSGTEPLVRIMVESEDVDRLETVMQQLVRTVESVALKQLQDGSRV